ncbi:MAG: hypothetical protein ACPHUL_00390 [Marinomonas gallaica]
MSNNLKHIDDRLVEQEAKRKQAAENADEKAFNRAETEIKALTEMRKFYSGEHE